MASDYGDEAGEKLFDWMLRMGQDASQDAIRASAERLKNAIRNLRGQIDEPLAEAEHESVRDYARLNSPNRRAARLRKPARDHRCPARRCRD